MSAMNDYAARLDRIESHLAIQQPTGPNLPRWDEWHERRPTLPHAFPSWRAFWESSDPALLNELSSEP